MMSCCFKRSKKSKGKHNEYPSTFTLQSTYSGSHLSGLDLANPNELTKPENEEDIQRCFETIVDDLFDSHEAKLRAYKLAPDKKWHLYVNFKRESGKADDTQIYTYITYLDDLAKKMVLDDVPTLLLDNLTAALRTHPISFVRMFFEMGGLDKLLDVLARQDDCDDSITLPVLRCLYSSMNTNFGREAVMANERAIPQLCSVLPRCVSEQIKLYASNMLSVLTISDEHGWFKLMQAIESISDENNSRRFHFLVREIMWASSVDLKVSLLTLINAILHCIPSRDDLVRYRMHLRADFEYWGLKQFLNSSENKEISNLARQIEVYFYLFNDDAAEFGLDVSSANERELCEFFVFDDNCHAKSILYHSAMMLSEHKVSRLRLAALLMEQVTVYPEETTFDNSKKIIDFSVSKVETFLEDLEDSNKKMEVSLTQARSKITYLESDKEFLTNQVDGCKKTIVERNQSIEILTMENSKLKIDLESLKRELARTIEAASSGVVTNDKTDFNTNKTDEEKSVALVPKPPGAPPPPPPPPGAVPPPPGLPPSVPSIPAYAKPKGRVKRLHVPPITPGTASKTFDASLWSCVSVMRALTEFDIKELECVFGEEPTKTFSLNTKTTRSNSSPRVREILSPPRRKAIEILLQSLKMNQTSEDQVIDAIESLDEHHTLTAHLCYQLINMGFPTADEEAELKMAGADNLESTERFMLKMSEIPNCADRLRAIAYSQTFHEKVGDCEGHLTTLVSTCRQIRGSPALRRLLTLTAALSALLNPNAAQVIKGVRVSGLSKLIETRTSRDSNETALHYILTMDQSLQDLPSQIQLVIQASRCPNLNEISDEVNSLKSALTQGVLNQMPVFGQQCSDTMTNLCNLLSETEKEMNETYLYLAEPRDNSALFADMAQFVSSLAKVVHQIHLIERKRKQIASRSLESNLKQRGNANASRPATAQKTRARQTVARINSKSKEGQIDDLLSALQSGNLFHGSRGSAQIINPVEYSLA